MTGPLRTVRTAIVNRDRPYIQDIQARKIRCHRADGLPRCPNRANQARRALDDDPLVS